MNISDRIREEREKVGLSQAAFAGVAQATKVTQLRWEQGAAFPNAAVLESWAKIGVDVLYIITGQRSSSSSLKPNLEADEQVLLSSYRAAPDPVRNAALAVLLSGGHAPEGVDTSKERKGRAAPRKHIQQTNIGSGGINIAGDVVSGKKK